MILRWVSYVLILFMLVSCGGGGSGDGSSGGDDSQTPTTPEEPAPSAIGPIPDTVSYTIQTQNGALPINELDTVDVDINKVFSANDEQGELIYWGSGVVAAYTGHALDGTSSTVMLIYALLGVQDADDAVQQRVIELIAKHENTETIAQALESVVQNNGFLLLDELPQDTIELISAVIEDIRQTALDDNATAQSDTGSIQIGGDATRQVASADNVTVQSKTGGIQIDGDQWVSGGWLDFSELKFADSDPLISVEGGFANVSRLFYYAAVVKNPEDYDNDEVPDQAWFIIGPRKDVGLKTLGSAIAGSFGFDIGTPYALTDLARAEKSSFIYDIPKDWAIGTGDLGRHWIIADPNQHSLPRLLNVLHAATPILKVLGIGVPELAKYADPNEPTVQIIKEFADVHQDEIEKAYRDFKLDTIWTLSELYMKLVELEDKNNIEIDRFDRLALFAKRFFDFAGKVTTTVNAVEALQQLQDVELKTFQVDPIPIEITDVTPLGENRYRVDLDIFGQDTQPWIGDDTYDVVIQGVKTLDDKLNGSISSLGSVDWSSTTITLDASKSTASVEIEWNAQSFWVVAFPGADSGCIYNAVCSAIDNNDLIANQTGESRRLVNRQQNVALACNGAYEPDTNTCLAELYYDDGELWTITPYVDGVINGEKYEYDHDGNLVTTMNYVPKEVVRSFYDPNTSEPFVQRWQQGFAEGVAKDYHENGDITETPIVAKPDIDRQYRREINTDTGEIFVYETITESYEQMIEGEVKTTNAAGIVVSTTPYQTFPYDVVVRNQDGELTIDSDFWVSCEYGVAKTFYASGNLRSTTPYSVRPFTSEQLFYYSADNSSLYSESKQLSVVEGTITEYHDLPGEIKKRTTPYVVQPAQTHETYDAEGRTIYSASYAQSVEVGIVTTYHENGNVKSEAPYVVASVPAALTYDSQDRLREKGPHFFSEISGTLKHYYSSASPQSATDMAIVFVDRESYSPDVPDYYRTVSRWPESVNSGNDISYYENGAMEQKSIWSVTTGLRATTYDENSNLLRNTQFSDSSQTQTIFYYQNGVVSQDTLFKTITGKERTYTDSGILLSETDMLLSAESGIQKTYFESSALQSEQTYQTVTGKARAYSDSGKLLSESDMLLSAEYGLQKTYFESSVLQSEQTYEQFLSENTSYNEADIAVYRETALLTSPTGEKLTYYESSAVNTRANLLARQSTHTYYLSAGRDEYAAIDSFEDGMVTTYYENGQVQRSEPRSVLNLGARSYFYSGTLTIREDPVYKSVVDGTVTQYYDHGQVSGTTPYSVYRENMTQSSGDSGTYTFENAESLANGLAWYYSDNRNFPADGTYLLRSSTAYTQGVAGTTSNYYSDGSVQTSP